MYDIYNCKLYFSGILFCYINIIIQSQMPNICCCCSVQFLNIRQAGVPVRVHEEAGKEKSRMCRKASGR